MRFVVVKSSVVAAVLSVVTALGTLIGLVGGYGVGGTYFGKIKKKLPIYCVQREDKVVALTFDATWGTERTERILTELNAEGVPATFFLSGIWVEANPEAAVKIRDAGMEIGTHSNTHPHMASLSEEQIRLELSTSVKLIEDVTAVKADLFRAPFGEYNDRVLTTAEGLGLFTIQWDVDSLDWKDYTATKMAERILSKVNNGSIVLMHNDGKYTPDALPLIIAGLKNKGYSFVTVGDLIYRSNYRMDNTGKQIPLAQ